MNGVARALGDLRGRALLVVFGCLVVQMGLGYAYVFSTLAPDLLEEFGWSRTEWSARYGVQVAVTAVASPVVGTLCVRLGTRAVVAASVFLLGVAFAGFGAIEDIWHVYALTPLIGLGLTGVGDIAVGGVIPRWIARSRGLALGIVYTGANIGGFLLSRSAAWLADTYSWRAAFVVLGATGVAVILPVALWAVRDPGPHDQTATADFLEASHSSNEPELDLSAALRTRSFWLISLALFGAFFYFVAMIDLFVLHLTDLGYTRSDAAAYYSWIILMGLVSKIGFGFIADHTSHKLAAVATTVVFGATAGLALFLDRPGALWVFVIVYGFTAASRDVIYPLMVADCFGVRYVAQIYGAMTLVLWPAGTFGPVFAAWGHDVLGSYELAIAGFGLLNVLTGVSLLGIRRESGRTT